MGFLHKLLGDFCGLSRTLGIWAALRWLAWVAFHGATIIRQRNLQPADQAMGSGPFRVCFRPGVEFRIGGGSAISGIREMYVRDVYLRQGVLTIEDGDVVVDLGANMGNFSNLALAHGRSVTVFAVEPAGDLNMAYRQSIALNPGFSERATLVRAFFGSVAEPHKALLQDERYRDAPWLGEDELIALCGLSRVDFLKCDIEGGEFQLLHPGSKLLTMAQKIAIEIHQFAGDVDGFMAMLKSQGFVLRFIQRDADGSATVLAARAG
jgi:FkbM family methyltransferase